LRLRGALPLHASAVVVDDHSIALMGGPGAGKSTTAAGFARLGHAVLSDDLAALREVGSDFLVQPGYPRVNVWPDSAVSLFGSEDFLSPISPTWNKRFMALDQNGLRFERRALSLGAIYLLGKREANLPAPIIEEMGGASAMINLVANTYGNYLLDTELRRDEFSILNRLLARVTVRFVRPPAEPACLRGLCEAIETDAKKLFRFSSDSSRLERAQNV
jgi:hypothetical protein